MAQQSYEFPIITYDHRGNSRSPATADPQEAAAIDRQADDAASLIGPRGFEQAVVFGTSGGGVITLDVLRATREMWVRGNNSDAAWEGLDLQDASILAGELRPVLGARSVRHDRQCFEEDRQMPMYLYQAAYTGESLEAQIHDPQDRIEVVRPAFEAVGARIVAGGYPFGEYDVLVVYEAPDDTVAAGLAQAIAAGGSVKAGQTTRLLSGAEWVDSLRKAKEVSEQYRPAR